MTEPAEEAEGLLLDGLPVAKATNRDLLYAIRERERLVRDLPLDHPRHRDTVASLELMVVEAQRRVGLGENWRLLPASEARGE